jgi:hypothetical protein
MVLQSDLDEALMVFGLLELVVKDIAFVEKDLSDFLFEVG